MKKDRSSETRKLRLSNTYQIELSRSAITSLAGAFGSCLEPICSSPPCLVCATLVLILQSPWSNFGVPLVL